MTPQLSRNEGSSLHHQIMVVLRSQIHAGQLAHGDIIPAETSLMRQYGVSRATVRRALQTLENEGLIERRQGKGTRVTYLPSTRPSLAHNVQMIETLAAKTSVKVLSYEWAVPPPEAAAALGLPLGERALRIARLRSAGKTPLRYIVNFLPAVLGERMRRADFLQTTLPSMLQTLGCEPVQFDDTIGAIAADPELARALQVKIGAPLLELVRVIYGQGHAPVAYQWTIIPPARGALRMSIKVESE